MKCPFCQEGTKVIDKRELEEGAVTRRRRECLKCEKRFTTYERVETPPIMIVKKDGRRELFNIQKLKMGILKACEKRPVAEQQIDEVVKRVEQRLYNYNATEIPSKKVGETVIRELKKLDKIAYIRFASIYHDFEDISEFKEELDKLEKK
ncbi:transcriptional repressor NrdR [Candidatus Woesearchaeota archaeon]|nr:transcriptional repressor NrdR [Candidatus Woesearchaeota archaeon]